MSYEIVDVMLNNMQIPREVPQRRGKCYELPVNYVINLVVLQEGYLLSRYTQEYAYTPSKSSMQRAFQ